MLLSTVSVHLPVFQSVPARVRRHRVHRNAGVPRVRDTEPALPNRPPLTRALCPAIFRGISLRMGSSSGPCVGGFSSLSIGLVRKLRDAKTREAGSAPAGGKGRASRAPVSPRGTPRASHEVPGVLRPRLCQSPFLPRPAFQLSFPWVACCTLHPALFSVRTRRPGFCEMRMAPGWGPRPRARAPPAAGLCSPRTDRLPDVCGWRCPCC